MEKDIMNGREVYRNEKRIATLKKIEEAILFLQENRFPINKSAIAAQAGLHRNTMGQEYVREYLGTTLNSVWSKPLQAKRLCL